MKLNATQTHIKVPLSQLKITTNVRQDFDEAEIAELAQSIRDNGLINAITVKPPVTDENGDKTYEVIAGGRRIRAHQFLFESCHFQERGLLQLLFRVDSNLCAECFQPSE